MIGIKYIKDSLYIYIYICICICIYVRMYENNTLHFKPIQPVKTQFGNKGFCIKTFLPSFNLIMIFRFSVILELSGLFCLFKRF